jgi:hypothetical protein
MFAFEKLAPICCQITKGKPLCIKSCCCTLWTFTVVLEQQVDLLVCYCTSQYSRNVGVAGYELPLRM